MDRAIAIRSLLLPLPALLARGDDDWGTITSLEYFFVVDLSIRKKPPQQFAPKNLGSRNELLMPTMCFQNRVDANLSD